MNRLRNDWDTVNMAKTLIFHLCHGWTVCRHTSLKLWHLPSLEKGFGSDQKRGVFRWKSLWIRNFTALYVWRAERSSEGECACWHGWRQHFDWPGFHWRQPNGKQVPDHHKPADRSYATTSVWGTEQRSYPPRLVLSRWSYTPPHSWRTEQTSRDLPQSSRRTWPWHGMASQIPRPKTFNSQNVETKKKESFGVPR